MIFSTNSFNDIQRNETLFTLANGSIGFRGNMEERSGSSHKGTYINGFYDSEPIMYGENAYGYAKNHETMLNLPDTKFIEMTVDGKKFGINAEGTISEFLLELDTEKGFLSRITKWEVSGKSKVELHSKRLVSFSNPECAVIKYCVKNTSNETEKIYIQSAIDTTSSNILAEEDPRIGAKFRHKPLIIDFVSAKNKELSFTAHTANSKLFLAGFVSHTVEIENQERITASSTIESGLAISSFEFNLPPSSSFTLIKYISYVHSKTEIDCLKKAEKLCMDFENLGFENILKEQKKVLDKFWNTAKISIDGDRLSEEALNFNLFHLFQSAGRDGKTSIAAKGLTSEGYEGHYFWDTESYICPVFTYTAPQIAKKLLEYRHSILEKAKERAEIMSVKGALFPWRTISGEETSAYYPAGTAQYHINADIAFALQRYINAHSDFDEEKSKEIFVQTAKMYASLASKSLNKDNLYCINDVTGPDEYTAIVNNNAFTNFMARENLEMSIKNAESCISKEELELWKNISQNLYIPFDKKLGIYPQDDSFMDKADWDFKNTASEKYPLLLHFHPLVIYRHRVLKQPDLVLAQFLLSGRFSLAEKIRNFDFYEPYTTGDSSLSHCIMSIMAAECGYTQKAEEYFRKTVRMDIDDVNGNSKDGIHTACMAGSWMGVVYGFAGFRDYKGTYLFSPKLPQSWKTLNFSLNIKNCILDIKITQTEAQYSLRKESKNSLSFMHRNIPVELKQGDTKTFNLTKKLSAILFDLDGVITDTAELHYEAWFKTAQKEGLKFDRNINSKLLGVSREESLEIILAYNNTVWPLEKKQEICRIKNEIYKEKLKTLSKADVLPGIIQLLEDMKKASIPAVLASSSKNAKEVIERLEISQYFCAIADASKIQKAKPEPDIFLEAAKQAGTWHTDCLCIEDAEAGIQSIKKAGMTAVAISPAKNLKNADLQIASTKDLNLKMLKQFMEAAK